MTGLRRRRPAVRRAVYVATVTGDGAAGLERAALRRARLYFAGEDVTTLAIDSHAARVDSGRDDDRRRSFAADITVSCQVAGERQRCPRCGQQVPARAGVLAVHDKVAAQYPPGGFTRAWAEPCQDSGGAS